jgi:hypothetical protein
MKKMKKMERRFLAVPLVEVMKKAVDINGRTLRKAEKAEMKEEPYAVPFRSVGGK